jgi:hypothetical protein
VRSTKTPYAENAGQYVVAVQHTLEGFSSSVTIAFKYFCIPSSISNCKLTWNLCVRLITQISFVTCRLAQGFLCRVQTPNKAAGTAQRNFHTRVTINWFSYFIFVFSRPT